VTTVPPELANPEGIYCYGCGELITKPWHEAKAELPEGDQYVALCQKCAQDKRLLRERKIRLFD
jgi:hypothetical protein